MSDYGQRVRSCRESLCLSQNALAVMVGGSWRQTTVARVEAGEQSLKLADAVRLAEVFGMSLDEFAGGHSVPCRCAAVRGVLREALAALEG